MKMIMGRVLCFLFGHVSDKVWLNYALRVEVPNPERPGTSKPTPEWEKFGGGNIYLCPRCRVLFML